MFHVMFIVYYICRELLFNIVTPAIQVILFCIAIGQMPRDLEVAVYNADQPPPHATHHSKNFLDQIDATYIHLVSITSSVVLMTSNCVQ